MKTNGLRGFIYKALLLVLLSLYFLLVFSQTRTDSASVAQTGNRSLQVSGHTGALPRLLSFEGKASNKKVRLDWKFETTDGLDECILERSDRSKDFKPVAYFFMTEDIHIPNLHYTDSVPHSKTYYYRLKITGKDGKGQYTKTLTFKTSAKDEEKSLSDPLVME